MRPLLVVTLLSISTAAWSAPQAPVQGARKVDAASAPAPRAHGHDEGTENEAPRADESNVDYLWRKADVAFHLGEYERVIAIHKAIEALDPSDTESFGVAAWLMWSMGDNDAAIAHIKRGLAANPNNWEMWNDAGQQYDCQKQFVMAVTAYKRTLELAPKDTDTQMLRRRLAHSAEHAGDIATSIETWRGLVKDFPAEDVNKNNLARVEALSKKPLANISTYFGIGLAQLARLL